jgi:hypothetical protein
VIQRVGKAKPGDDKQVGDNTEIESRGVWLWLGRGADRRYSEDYVSRNNNSRRHV